MNILSKLPEALQSLAAYPQFILWILTERNGKQVKLPVNYLTTDITDAHNPEAWTDAQTAINTARLFGDNYGVGFVFTKNDPFYFVDIDKCLLDSGEWSDTAKTVLSYFPGAAVEVSQSGKGLHIFGTASNCPNHACKNVPLGLEFYTEGRFVALTGNNIIGDASTSADEWINNFIINYMAPRVIATPEQWTAQPLHTWNGPDDETLIKKALASKSGASAFGVRATFRNLWECDVEALSAAYAPDENDAGEFDESSADMALAQHLAFWTGKNCEHIERLMWLSGLVRIKWTKHKNYLRNTITRAVSLQNDADTYKGNPPKVSLEKAESVICDEIEPGLRVGYQFLGPTQQIEYFKGCVYVQDVHRIFTPGGAFLRPDQFNATYGGYVFAMDDANRKETRKAWEAFTESQVVRYKKAETTCFMPTMATGVFINVNGVVAVNTYVPSNIRRVQGDPSPFLLHLSKVLPIDRDREILLAYMAACIQYKGIKFQWAPLIQGAEGNGKTLFTRCVAYAVGEQYTHWPNASDIHNKFNSWLMRKLLIGVEDIYVPNHKREIIEILKPMITGGDGFEIQSKGVDQVSAIICANFMFNSNHKDAIQKTRNDRRFAVFYTAQQTIDDIKRDGMEGSYFPNLYRWLKDEDGYAIVANYLGNYQIPDELNPAISCHRAPDTSSTESAIQASMGDAEILIIDAVDNDLLGFRGGIIWTKSAIELLRNNGKNIHTNALSRVLENIGYMKHPAADSSGRIKINGKRERFYVKRGHLISLVKTPSDLRIALHEISAS